MYIIIWNYGSSKAFIQTDFHGFAESFDDLEDAEQEIKDNNDGALFDNAMIFESVKAI